MKKSNEIRRAVLAALLSGAAWPAQPTTTTVTVTVLAPLPCEINGSKPIEVDFGDEVMTTRIDGNNYQERIDVPLSCNGQVHNAMRFQINGAPAGFDGRLLQTSVNGLGIALLRDGARFAPNSWQNFTYPDLPKLEAVPVRQSKATLPTGEFSAAATMRIDYQ